MSALHHKHKQKAFMFDWWKHHCLCHAPLFCDIVLPFFEITDQDSRFKTESLTITFPFYLWFSFFTNDIFFLIRAYYLPQA